MLVSDLSDWLGHRGRKQSDLLIAGTLIEDPLDVIDKSHSQHFVGFIEDQGFERIDPESRLTHVVHDSTRSPHHDVSSTLESVDLVHIRSPPIDRGNAQTPQVLSVLEERLRDLVGQFSRGSEHQDLSLGDIDIDVGQKWQSERGGLARPRLSLAQHIATCEHRWDRRGLDVGRCSVTGGF